MSTSNSMLLGSLIGVGIVLIVVLLALVVLVYVFESLAIYTIASAEESLIMASPGFL